MPFHEALRGFGGRPLEDTSFLDGSSFRSPGPDLTVD